MMDIILALTLVIFHEDRNGSITSQWAVGNVFINRVERYRSISPFEILSKPHQFPWARKMLECNKSWGPADNAAWRKAQVTAKLVWASRKRISHPYACFHLNDGKYRRISQGRASKQYGPHIFYSCKI